MMFRFKKRKKIIEIILVDDNNSVLTIIESVIKRLIKKSFENIEYKLYKYHSYNELKQSKKYNYDIGIIDWNLPDCTGSKIISKIKSSTERIALYTGMTDDNVSISEFCLNNNVTYIPKSVEIDQVSNYIHKSLDRSLYEFSYK